MVAVDTAAVQRHRNTIVECVKDADVSIRRRALDLVYALVNENNIKTLTNELLEYLEVCDEEFKPDLTAKICMLVQRFSPDKRWYIDSLGQVLVQAGAYVKEEVVRALVVTISNAPALQGYAVRLLYRALINMVEDGDEALRLAALWCLGACVHCCCCVFRGDVAMHSCVRCVACVACFIHNILPVHTAVYHVPT